MSERHVEIVQALLHELIEIVAEKPSLAKRLIEAIDYRLTEPSLDPLLILNRSGEQGLRDALKPMSGDQLKLLVKQHNIPCQNIAKRKKADLIGVIVSYARNTDIGIATNVGEAA